MAIFTGPHTIDRTVKATSGLLRGFSVFAGTTNAALVLYDSVDNSGNIIGKITIPKAEKAWSLRFHTPVRFSTALFADVLGTAAAYSVEYE